MKTILIIDDEPGFCSLIREAFELTGKYKVLIETSGRNAVRSAEWHQPDLILLDVMMPDLDGIEVLKRLKESRKTVSIPVIILTVRDDDRLKKEAASLYDEDYIVKPVSILKLKNKVEEIMSRA